MPTLIDEVVILAAGVGSRLRPLTEEIPKALLAVGGKTILEHQLEAAEALNPFRVTVVIGHGARKIKQRFRRQVQFVFNPFYAVANDLVSLWSVRHRIRGNFIYLHGDVLCDPEVIRQVSESEADVCLAVQRHECQQEEEKVVVQEKRVLEIGKEILPQRAYGEFLGIAKFSPIGAKRFQSAVKRLVQEGAIGEFCTQAIQKMIQQGFQVEYHDIGSLHSIEIDTMDDLQKAERLCEKTLV